MECPICVSSVGKGKEIVCSHCDYKCCIKCFERWIVSYVGEPKCIQCAVEYPLDILDKKITKQFYNKTYKPYRKDMLFEREQALIPSTMQLVEREKRKQEIQGVQKTIKTEISKLKGKIRELTTILYDTDRQMWNIVNERDENANTLKYRYKCPIGTCLGYVNEDTSTCGLCNKKICMLCMTEKEDEHECDKNVVKNVATINKSSKPCPQCNERIIKSEGCNQMWCTQCHVFFDWATGGIITHGARHNPEYFRWMRENNITERQPGDIECGGVPNITIDKIVTHTTYPTYRSGLERLMLKGKADDYSDVKLEILRLDALELPRKLNHFFILSVNRRWPNINIEDVNRINRVKYIMGELTKEQFTSLIMKAEKDRMYNIRMRHIAEILVYEVRAYYAEFIETNKTDIQSYINTVIPKLKSLATYINQCYDNLAREYNRMPLVIKHIPLFGSSVPNSIGEWYWSDNIKTQHRNYPMFRETCLFNMFD